MRELAKPRAPVTRGVTFLGASWSSPTATTMSIDVFTRATNLSLDFFSFASYCSSC